MAGRENLEDNYGRGRFGGRLGVGMHPALLLVDLSHAYLEPESALFAGDSAHAAVAACGQLLDAARGAGAHVIHTRIVLSGPHSGGLFVRKVPSLEMFRSAGPLTDFPEAARPREGETVISKEYASAFFGTPLASTLAASGIDTVVIGGLSTSGCVRATAVDAMQSGVVPLVVAEACGDRHPEPHDAALFDLDNKYADVIHLDEAIRILTATR